MVESGYNAPRLHVAIEARKIVVSGEAAGLQIQMGPPAVPGRFDSCDLPPKFLIYIPPYVNFKEKTVTHFLLNLAHDLSSESQSKCINKAFELIPTSEK